MKKTTKKQTTPATPAPAPVVKKTKAQAKPAPVKTVVAKAPVKKVAKKAAPAVVPASVEPTPALTAPTTTVIQAQVDVGFGNTLYLRGEGPGLSWEEGVAMDCVADDKWSITIKGATAPVVFKFLLNDLTWCAGEDFVVAAGGTTDVKLVF